MPSESHIKYRDIVSGQTSTNLTELPSVGQGYDSYFIQTPKPKKLIESSARGVLRYISAMPVKKMDRTLGEGGTPLIASKVFPNTYIKNEGMNPTGSFKDRESVLALAYAHENGITQLAIASSGNAALSAALYSRIYNITTTCYVPDRTPQEKIDMIDLFGGRTHIIGHTYEGSYHYLLNNLPTGTTNITSGVFPLRSDGVKSIAYEIWEDLRAVPDVVICPAGNGSALASIYHGFADLKNWGYTDKIPRMISVQIKGGDPINLAINEQKWISTVSHVPDSICEAIIAEESFCAPKAIYAVRESHGMGISLDDNQVIEGVRFAIDKEGIFPEFSSASVFSALMEYESKVREKDETVVLINTATGIKDIEGIRESLAEKTQKTSDS